MNTDAWQSSPVPAATGPTREWQVTSAADLHFVRAEVGDFLRSAGGERYSGRAASRDRTRECVLATVDELATNGLIHGLPPVTASIAANGAGWLVDVSDGGTDRIPQPAVGRDPARGGMGLNMVAALSDSCGWCVVARRKHVWACCH